MVTNTQTIPAGFKMTEVGVIPEDWMLSCIRDLASITTGTKDTQDKVDDGEFPFFVRSSLVEKINSYSFDGEAVLTAGDGVGTGKVFHYINGKFDFHQRVYSISNFSKSLRGFFFYLYFSTHFYKRIMSMTAKSSVDSVRMGMIADMLIPLPPLPEQTAIATVLSDTDALIEFLEKLIVKKKAIKQGTMQQLLTGKKRLPGFEKKEGYKQTEVGVIPEDWDAMAMGDLGQSLIGLTYSPRDVKDYGTLVLRSSNIQNGKLAFKDNVFVKMDLPDRVMVEENDILICVRNGSRQLIGKCTLIDKTVTGSAFGAFMSVYRSKYANYIFYQFQSNIIQRQINEVMGATINQLTNKDLAVFKIALPRNETEQGAITKALRDMDAEIENLEQKRDKYKRIKQGMMQQLLTGKIRLL